MNNMLIVTLASVGIFLAVSGNLNVSGNLLPLIVVAGVSLWCVQNRKSNKKMGESCFLVSIYFLSVLLSKMLDINEKFNTVTLPSATDVNTAITTYTNWGASQITSATDGVYELYYIALDKALKAPDGKLITTFVNDPSIFQSFYENAEIKKVIGEATTNDPLLAEDLKKLLDKVIQNEEKIQSKVPAEGTILEYYRKILTHIQSNPNILIRLASASTPQARLQILKEIMVPYQDLITDTANQYGVSQDQINLVQNRVLDSLEKNSQVLNNLLSNLNINNLINQNNLPSPNLPNIGDAFNCENISTKRQLIQQFSPENLSAYNDYVTNNCNSNNSNDKHADIGKLAEYQSRVDDVGKVNLGVGEIAGITGGAVGFVLLCVGAGVFLSRRNN